MNIKHKNTSLIALAIAFIVFLAPTSLLFIADPCQIFHKPIKGIFNHGFSGDAGCQNAGIINTYLKDKKHDFNSIFTGTSLSGNFLPEEIARKLPQRKTLKLTLPGAKPFEQQIITERALSTGSVRHVYWEVFPYQFLIYPFTSKDEIKKSNIFPFYLYNKGRIDDYRYLFRTSSIAAFFGILNNEDYYNTPALDRIDYWSHQCNSEKNCKPFHNTSDIDNIKSNYNQPKFRLLEETEISAIDFSAADQNLLSTLLPYCNKEISFDLIFPPVSMLWFSRQSAKDFNYQLYMLRYVVSKTNGCHNIRIFAFNNEEWITGDLAHYHDPRHFYGGVHNYIIEAMASGNHVIRMDNIREFERIFIEDLNNYTPWASTEEQLRDSKH